MKCLCRFFKEFWSGQRSFVSKCTRTSCWGLDGFPPKQVPSQKEEAPLCSWRVSKASFSRHIFALDHKNYVEIPQTSLFMRHPLFPSKWFELTIEQLVVILYDSCQHLFPFITAGERGGGDGGGAYRFVFYTPNNNRNYCWALFPFWHQYRFRTLLLRRSSSAAELASPCLGLETTRAAYLSSATQNRRPGPFLSPVPFSPTLPANYQFPFENTMTLSFDSWEFLFVVIELFFLPLRLSHSPLFFFLSV